VNFRGERGPRAKVGLPIPIWNVYSMCCAKKLGLTGTKEGCGECEGVSVAPARLFGRMAKLANSCLMPRAASRTAAEILTVEGLGEERSFCILCRRLSRMAEAPQCGNLARRGMIHGFVSAF